MTRWLAAVTATLFSGLLFAQPPAFPGAEGYGASTRGGGGGKALLVVNLNDSGPGSFRAACEAKGPRIIVFRVAGIVDLKSPVDIREPYLTIAGQTAPGGGICIRGNAVNIATHDVVVQHIRIRPGDLAGTPQDGLMVQDGSRNVVIDHCSVSWATDENLSPSGDIADVTVSWCIISEGLNRSVHHKGSHGYGSLARATGGISLHHNLWAHNRGRNPRIGDNYGKPPFPTYDIRNNVMYNFGGLSLVGDVLSANYVSNYLKPGPDTGKRGGRLDLTDRADTRFYVAGNVEIGYPQYTASPEGLFTRLTLKGRPLVRLLQAPLETPPVSTTSAEEAYEAVLAGAGATLPVRDAADARVIQETRTGTGAIIDSQWEVSGWPEYAMARPPRDTDRDGMPDAWETAQGLNPTNAADAVLKRPGSSYTNLEEYIHSLSR